MYEGLYVRRNSSLLSSSALLFMFVDLFLCLDWGKLQYQSFYVIFVIIKQITFFAIGRVSLSACLWQYLKIWPCVIKLKIKKKNVFNETGGKYLIKFQVLLLIWMVLWGFKVHMNNNSTEGKSNFKFKNSLKWF